MVAKGSFRLVTAFAVLAKLAASLAVLFVFLSAVSTSDDAVQQEALAQPQVHLMRICKLLPPGVVSTALVPAISFRLEPNTGSVSKIDQPEFPAPLAESIRPLCGRSPPRAFSL